MSKELEKNYNPSEIEDRLYQKWLDKKYFHAEVDRSKKPFTIGKSSAHRRYLTVWSERRTIL